MSDRTKKALDELLLKLLPVTEDPTFQVGRRHYPNGIPGIAAETDMPARHEPPAPNTKTLH